MRRKGLDQPAEPLVYLSYRQFTLPFMTLFARGSDPAAIAADVRAAVRTMDPELPVGTPETVAELRARSLAEPRFRTALLGLFALLGLTLAAVGLYGVVGEGVARRAREIGIRMALGAGRGEVLRLVLARGVRLSVYGAAAGLLASLALGRVVASFLFGVGASDPFTLAAVCALLLAVSFVAAYVPARRASRLDPVTATRAE